MTCQYPMRTTRIGAFGTLVLHKIHKWEVILFFIEFYEITTKISLKTDQKPEKVEK